MPIYAYACDSCGHQKDVLQKIADPALTVCPACGQPAFKKQVTAAGFQLKGGGWYATDFKNKGQSESKGGAAASTAATGAEVKASTAAPEAPATASSPAGGHSCGSGGCGSCS